MKFKLFASAILLSGTAALSFAQEAASTPFHGTPAPTGEIAAPEVTPTPVPKVKPVPKPTATVVPKEEQAPPPTAAPTAPPPPPSPTAARAPTETPAPAPAAAPRTPARKPTASPTPPQQKLEREGSFDRGDDAGGVAGVIKAFEKEWEASLLKHDSSVIERLVADDFIGVSSTGKIGDKLALLYESKRDKNVYKIAAARQLSVRVYGPHVAVALGITRESGTDNAGRPFDHTFRFTDTWLERGGKWQCVAAHAAVASRK